jgi:hypothetical protein
MTEVTKNAAEITNEAIEVMINNDEKESTTIMDDIVKAAIEENEEIIRKSKIDEAKNILSTLEYSIKISLNRTRYLRAYEKLSTELLKQITELKNKFIETGDANIKKKIAEIRITYNDKLKDLKDKFDRNFSAVDWGF